MESLGTRWYKMIRTKGIFGIYKIDLNNKIYIGSTIQSFNQRWKEHLSAFQNGRNSPHMQNAYNKYGEATLRFSILEIVKDKKDCLSREQYYIDTLKPQYNIQQIAGSNIGIKLSEETKRKMREAAKGRIIAEETKRKMRDSHKNISEEFRQKMREINTGRKHSEKTKRKISESEKGKIISEKTRKKISKAMKGR